MGPESKNMDLGTHTDQKVAFCLGTTLTVVRSVGVAGPLAGGKPPPFLPNVPHQEGFPAPGCHCPAAPPSFFGQCLQWSVVGLYLAPRWLVI